MKIMVWKSLARMSAAAVAAAVMAIPAVAQAPDALMLDNLAKGAWTLRIRDSGAEQRVCIRNGRELIQIQHKQSGCKSFVVSADNKTAVVQYTCRGNGYGRTSLRQESKGLVQVESQGIYNDTPFAFSAEARYMGRC